MVPRAAACARKGGRVSLSDHPGCLVKSMSGPGRRCSSNGLRVGRARLSYLAAGRKAVWRAKKKAVSKGPMLPVSAMRVKYSTRP